MIALKIPRLKSDGPVRSIKRNLASLVIQFLAQGSPPIANQTMLRGRPPNDAVDSLHSVRRNDGRENRSRSRSGRSPRGAPDPAPPDDNRRSEPKSDV